MKNEERFLELMEQFVVALTGPIDGGLPLYIKRTQYLDQVTGEHWTGLSNIAEALNGISEALNRLAEAVESHGPVLGDPKNERGGT